MLLKISELMSVVSVLVFYELWVNVPVAIFSVPVEDYGVLLCYGGKF